MEPIFVTDNSKACRKKNAHFSTCRRENRPFVFISPGKKYAWVELDMFTTNRNLDDSAVNKIFEVLKEFSGPKARVSCSHLICRADRVPKAMVETVATHIYNIAYETMPFLKHCFES